MNCASLVVSLFLGEDECGEILGLIDYLYSACNVEHPLQFLVNYCTEAPRGFWAGLMTQGEAKER